jgi:hypothetical protein
MKRVLPALGAFAIAAALVIGAWLIFYRLDCSCWPWQTGESCGCFSGA